MKRVNVLGLSYAATDYEEAADFVHDRAVERCSAAIFALPVHGVVTARENQLFKAATDVADLIVPDGQPIKWFMNWVCRTALDNRVYGPELVRHVLERAHQARLSVFLYGGATEEILNGFSLWIESEYPNVSVVGVFREPSMGTTTLLAQDVEATGANLVLCGLGCPAQEIWISQNKGEINAAMLGVGAAFSFHSGHLDAPPRWMQSLGLEWFFRLIKEPRRLWRRYLYTNSYFLLLVIRRFFVKCKD